MGSRFSLMASAQWYFVGKREFGRKGYERAARAFDAADDAISMRGRDVMVTGANAGLGLAVSEALLRRGATVHMVCRNRERGTAARAALLRDVGCEESQLLLHEADCGLAQSLKAFAANFLETHTKLDVLINNAGVLAPERMDMSDGGEACMSVALGGTFLLSGLLLPALAAGAEAAGAGARSRIINVSSGGMYMAKVDAADLDLRKGAYDGTLQYCRAKRAQVELTTAMQERLDAAAVPVDVHAMHPGWADTPGVRTSIPGFFKSNGSDFRTPEMGADTIVWLASTPKVAGHGGSFYLDRKAVSPHMPLAMTHASADERQALWGACEQKFDWVWAPGVGAAGAGAGAGATAGS